MTMKMYYLFFFLLLLNTSTLSAQWMEVTFCGATTSVEPAKDANGKDQRDKGALALHYIRVRNFGSQNFIIYDIGELGTDLKIDEKTYIDNCFNNSNPNNCNNCGTCIPPTSNGNPFGSIIAEDGYKDGLRVRGVNGGLLIESTGYTNQVCYTTPGLDLTNYSRKPVSLEVGFEGFEDGDFKSKGVEVYYTLNHGPKKWFKRLNKTVGKHEFKLSRTDAINITGIIEVDDVNDIGLHSTLVTEDLQIVYNINRKVDFEASIWSMDGVKVDQWKFSDGPVEEGHETREISRLNSGSYIVLVKTQNGESHPFRFVKI